MSKKKKVSALAISRRSSGGILASFNARSAKGDVKNTGIKTLADLIVGATAGAGIGAAAGKHAKWVGLGLILSGHYFGDESGLMRTAGVAAIAYGIAKHFENEELSGTVQGLGLLGEAQKAKTRLSAFKDEVLGTYYLDRLMGKKDDKVPVDPSSEMSGINLSSLDYFEELNEQQASEFDASQLRGEMEDWQDDAEPIAGDSEFSYAIIDDTPDFSKM